MLPIAMVAFVALALYCLVCAASAQRLRLRIRQRCPISSLTSGRATVHGEVHCRKTPLMSSGGTPAVAIHTRIHARFEHTDDDTPGDTTSEVFSCVDCEMVDRSGPFGSPARCQVDTAYVAVFGPVHRETFSAEPFRSAHPELWKEIAIPSGLVVASVAIEQTYIADGSPCTALGVVSREEKTCELASESRRGVMLFANEAQALHILSRSALGYLVLAVSLWLGLGALVVVYRVLG